MKTFIKIAALALLAICFASNTYAGEGQKGKKHGNSAERMIKHLDLDEGRANEIRTILKESREARKALADKRGDEAKALRTATKQKIEAVLTPQEVAKMKEFKKSQREKMKKHDKKDKKNKKEKKEA